MVVIVRLRGTGLALSLVCLSSTALGNGREVPRYLRTALDDDAEAAASVSREPRRFRTTLDDASHAELPLDNEGRLIRVSLDEGSVNYARLGPHPTRARHLRIALD